jgi:4-amino-4-deoxy-L-arabinose transferase-like glycosyltransferase
VDDDEKMENKTEEAAGAAAARPGTVAAQAQKQTRRKRRIRLAILLVAWLLIYLPALFHPALMDDADSVHAESAKEMLIRHDWVTLYVDGVRYLEKAPLMYWMTAVSYKLFGVSEWSTRLVLMISVLGLMGCAWLFGRRFFGEEGGFYAALILATAPGIYVYTRFLIPDVLVAMWLTLGFYFFLAGYEQRTPSRWMCWGLAVTAALNVLTKGLIGLAFPGLIILAFLVLVGDLAFLKKMHLFSSAIVFLIVAAPWHVLAAIRNPAQPTGPEKGFLWLYFINEQFLRFLNKRIPHDYGKVPLSIFWGLVLLWVVPWFVFLFPALREIPWRLRDWRNRLDARGRANLLLIVWTLMVMVFFSFSSRQEYYSLPVVPAVALLIAGWLAREERAPACSPERRWGRRMAAALAVLGVAICVLMLTLFALSKPIPAGTDIAKVLAVQKNSTYKLSLGHVQDLTLASFGAFHVPLLEFGLAMLVGTLLGWFWRRRGSPWRANLALAGMMVVVLFAVHQGLVVFSPEISSKRLAVTIERFYRPGDSIVINGDYEWGSTLNFYTGVRVNLLFGRRADMWFGSLFPDVPHVFWSTKFFDRQWNGPHRVFLFTLLGDRRRAIAGLNPHSIYLVAREGDKEVLTNRPLGPPLRAAGAVPKNGAS